MFKRKMDGDDYYRIEKKIERFCKTHKGELSKRDHRQLRKMLNKRAAVLSDVLGAKVGSICGK